MDIIDTEISLFSCKICNKKYMNYSGIWKHNKKYHNNTDHKNLYNCEKCKTFYDNITIFRRHKKVCEKKDTENEISNLKIEINKLETKINNLSSKPMIINNYTQNNNIVISCPPGKETIDHLSIEQKRLIMAHGLSSLIYLIEITNFDKSKPENHSYCVTALNDKHASIIDIKTNSIIKTDKIELYDCVLTGNLSKLEKLATDPEFTHDERLKYISDIERLKNILFISKKGIKKYYSEINLLSYNNKDLILETWNDLKKIDELVSTNKINSTDTIYKNQNIKLEENNYSLTSNIIDSDFSDDENENNIPTEIIIQGKQYFFDNLDIYLKKTDGTKGELYGKYDNGKIIKI